MKLKQKYPDGELRQRLLKCFHTHKRPTTLIIHLSGIYTAWSVIKSTVILIGKWFQFYDLEIQNRGIYFINMVKTTMTKSPVLMSNCNKKASRLYLE